MAKRQCRLRKLHYLYAVPCGKSSAGSPLPAPTPPPLPHTPYLKPPLYPRQPPKGTGSPLTASIAICRMSSLYH